MKNIIDLLKLYSEVIGWKIQIFLLFLMIFPPLLEGLSVTFLLPLIQGIDSESKINKVFMILFNKIGIDYTLVNILIIMVLTVTISAFILIYQTSVTSKILNSLTVKLRSQLIKESFELDYLKASTYSHGYLNQAIVNETNSVIFSFQLLATLLVSLFYALIYTLIPLAINPRLFFFMFVFGLLILPIFKWINGKVKIYSKLTSKKMSSLQSLLIQSLSNFKYLKATNQNRAIEDKISKESVDLGNVRYKQNLLAGISKAGFEPIIISIIAFLVYYFVEIRGENIIEFGFLIFLINRSLRSVFGMQQNMQKLFSSWGSVKVIKNFKEDLNAYKELKNSNPISVTKGDITLDNVFFSYGEDLILKNVSIDINENSTVAFVGESGSGKSTLVNIIIGLLKVKSGEVRIGGISLSNIDLESLRMKIGYITQESVIFNTSLKDNISLWDNTVSEDELIKKVSVAAEKSHLSSFLKNCSAGFETTLGENGVKMSGGQRQRVCIARELYKEPSILVCDEATSALDSETEREIQRNIDEMKGQCTIILIAHRLSTVKDADVIFVMKDGEVVESGSYDTLLKLNGHFKKMVELQS